MGIPKFFRWISERYPMCSQLITENRIPEFDNLYLDMNGIIHNCSHPNDDDVHFRLTEEQMFISIFNYIDHLFNKIKPKKLFFLAIDGVAPRAKMNQQRARRFRTAKDAADRRKKAQDKGEELPEQEAFDSNCITPGTEFMTKLSNHLKYFISKKVTEDANWRHVDVVLSGPETPGEGEHKIMEYIRLAKAQPEYEPNLRHCLYGLDADLIMLGLVTHEPHFSLLREEVTFGPKRKKGPASLDAQNFYLMHLSLFREYLDLEFSSLKPSLPPSIDYNLERVIDDFILLSLFVGNDFLPNLPNLHINEGALATLFGVYKRVLPKLGYINNGGKLDLAKCEAVFNELVLIERESFEGEIGDVAWLNAKKANGVDANGRGHGHHDRKGNGKNQKKNASLRGPIVLTPKQKELLLEIERFILERPSSTYHFDPSLPAKDRHFIETIAHELGLSCNRTALDSDYHLYIKFDEDDDTSDEESSDARARIFKRYHQAEVIDESVALVDKEEEKRKVLDREHKEWKKGYYKEKLGIEYIDDDQGQGNGGEDVRLLVFKYVQGLQWVLYYYYNGVCSWGWYYPYHYAPKISDLNAITDFNLTFNLGTPFRPFEQLMAVLPEASKTLLPAIYRDLMSNYTSPIIDFYPQDFELDMNGKKNDWEAVVKIPFINEERLLKAMHDRESRLTKDERTRNTNGPSAIFNYNDSEPYTYPSSLPGVFPDILRCCCKISDYNLPVLSTDLSFNKGLCDGVRLGVHLLPGFPTLHTIPHTSSLGLHGVNVFNVDSKNETIVVSLNTRFDTENLSKTETVATRFLGRKIYVNYPYLNEGLVRYVSDEHFKYYLTNVNGVKKIIKRPNAPEEMDKWGEHAERIEYEYSKRFAVITGPIEIILGVAVLEGMKRLNNGALVKQFAKQGQETPIALQSVVEKVETEDPRYMEKPPPPIKEEYPLGTRIFFLGQFNYGCPGQITDHNDRSLTVRLLVSSSTSTPSSSDADPNSDLLFTKNVIRESERQEEYYPSYVVAKKLGIPGIVLAKVASSLHVVSKTNDQRLNLGLNLKFDSRRQKVLGYTRKNDFGWEYSKKAMELVRSYKASFPEVFLGLEKRISTDFHKDTDFFPAEVAGDKMQEIREWLKKVVGVKEFERVPIDVNCLSKECIQNIEKAVDARQEMLSQREFKPVVIKSVPAQILLKPSHSETRLSHQAFELGDRVIYVNDAGNVPFAAKGTCIGLQKDDIEVLFDQSFMGGTSLNDRCSLYRGMTVHKSSVLNLTTPQPPYEAQSNGGAKQSKVEKYIGTATQGFPPFRSAGSASSVNASASYSSSSYSTSRSKSKSAMIATSSHTAVKTIKRPHVHTSKAPQIPKPALGGSVHTSVSSSSVSLSATTQNSSQPPVQPPSNSKLPPPPASWVQSKKHQNSKPSRPSSSSSSKSTAPSMDLNQMTNQLKNVLKVGNDQSEPGKKISPTSDIKMLLGMTNGGNEGTSGSSATQSQSTSASNMTQELLSLLGKSNAPQSSSFHQLSQNDDGEYDDDEYEDEDGNGNDGRQGNYRGGRGYRRPYRGRGRGRGYGGRGNGRGGRGGRGRGYGGYSY
ncbi:XRN 5'-3' exonuclease N-terminus-domain-containing protein [Paraphysoderma sedebokerense]|nr:XRN 5'-3' exonuclease N-terminus-domain-containing protein [Paraphysoderma sedebokerense]